jgi:endonuclease/exonuclease/phosphatase family metal-dependent hydrolase
VTHPLASTRYARLARTLALAALALAGFSPALFAQTTVTLSSSTQLTDDVTIRGGGYGSVNYSAYDALVSKNDAEPSMDRRILLKFDTQNTIPANTRITSAKLYLKLKTGGGSTARPLTVYRVTKSFLEREVTWYDYRDGIAWSAGGGDLGGAFGTTQVGSAVGTTYAFDVTDLVQRSVNGDFGSRYTRMAVVDTGSAAADSYREFFSSRTADSSNRPRLVITYGASATLDSGGSTLRVMQWNIHHDLRTDGVYDPNLLATWAAKLGADVVSMNEVPWYHGWYGNEDTPARLESLLESKTGRAWSRVYINTCCGNQGNLILSRFPFKSTDTRMLSYARGVAQATITVNGRSIDIFSTHVDYANSSYRTTQINQVKSYASGFSAPRIVLGDINTTPGTSDYNLLYNNGYVDAWRKAAADGTASGYKSGGATKGTVRFDYVFYTSSPYLTLKSVSVPNTKASAGYYPSDHDPVVATFSVN